MTPATRRLWAMPVVLGLLTATGLGSALVSDLWGDVWSWIALGLPVAVMAWHGLRRAADPARATSASGTHRTGRAGASAELP